MKQLGKLLIVSFGFVWLATNAHAQIAISADVIGGTPLTGQPYTNIKGSPFLLDTWEIGTVTMASGKKFENLSMMFDQVANMVIFRGADGQSKAFSQPVAAFTVKKGADVYNFERSPDGVFYEKLLTGKITLWKKNQKSIIDEKPYGSATVQRNILNNTSYYIGELSKLSKIKTDKKSIIALFGDKAGEVEIYIKKEKLGTKEDADLIRIFDYYNSL
ncbi:hypothetical protein [Emticicia sp. 21SJ11W-3]|uniref:hypothetical protein n=1 Tax=Emticicia sp. 21SJ11W-3 TaxID=2916755 RepID=UPI00209CD2A5|nr:hypothetical protein [Emticicia sp. 21SJ11W-3]UTA67701.1 hypothetical protein MB380_19195 [Emticicia sp. 21SJ11W-3]